MKYQQIINNVNTILSEYTMRLTLRQIYYRLVANFKLPNTRSNYNCLSAQLVKAREQGDVDEDRIEDRTRGFLGNEGFNNAPEFNELYRNWFLAAWKQYKRNYWIPQPAYVIVWVEKDALSRVLSDIADQKRAITAPSRGYASYSYIKKAIEKLPDKPVVILHFSDHDPSGLDMTRDLQERFQRYAPGRNIRIERISLTYDQVEKFRLDPNPVKIADTRSRAYRLAYGEQCWELDAIEPSELQKLVLAAIESHIDPDLWHASEIQEKKDQAWLKEKWDRYRAALEGS